MVYMYVTHWILNSVYGITFLLIAMAPMVMMMMILMKVMMTILFKLMIMICGLIYLETSRVRNMRWNIWQQAILCLWARLWGFCWTGQIDT